MFIMSKERGQIQALGVFLASILIFTTLTFCSTYLKMVQVDDQKTVAGTRTLKSMGVNALTQLDSNGTLGRLIDRRDWASIRISLLILLCGVGYNLTVYDEFLNPLNNETISHGFHGATQVVYVEYVCVSQDLTYHGYVLNLTLRVL
jgi:hypothetical protein